MKTVRRTTLSLLAALLFLLLPGISTAQDYSFGGYSLANSLNLKLYINGVEQTVVDGGWIQGGGAHYSFNQNYLTAYSAGNLTTKTYRSYYVFTRTGGGSITSASLSINSKAVVGTPTFYVSAVSGYTAADMDANRSNGDATGQAIFAAILNGTALGSAYVTNSNTFYSINLSNLLALENQGSTIIIGGRVESSSSYTAPTLTTNAASSVTATGAQLNGMITPNGNSGTYNFQYGTASGSYPSSTTAQSYTSGSSSFNAAISGLTGGTTYFYRTHATVSGHSDVYGGEQSFATPPPNLTSISASASTICNGGSTTLTANGTISGGTVYWYTSSCGGTSAGTGNTLTVYPTTTTTYYARNYKGGQYSASCVSTTITVNNPATTPSSASCTGTTATTASLSWGSSTGTGAITYSWVVGTTPSVTYPSGTTGWSGTTTDPTKIATATNLTPSTTYYLRVMASTAAPCGNSAYQTSSAFTTVPAAPVGSAATNVRANSFTANWNASTGATGYFLDVSTDPAFGSYLAGYQNKDMGTALLANLSGLSRNTNYYYRVRAQNTGGTSVSSGNITATTLDLNNFLVEKIGGGNIADQTSGTAFSIKITARDAMNSTVTDYTGTATITTNSVLTAGGNTTSFTAGVLASHSVTLTQAGLLKTLTATSGSVTGTSNTFTVLPGDINYWSLVVNGTVTAGVPFTVTATVYDAYGNVKTNYTGSNSVQWTTTATSSARGNARVIPANGNQTFTNGVATIGGFTFYNSDQSPLATITITDGPTAIAGTTAPITVYNSTLDNFKVVAGTAQQAGVPFDITVTARDVYWNTCRDYVGHIRFKSSDDAFVHFPAGLQPFVLADHGVRTFTNGIRVDEIGAYWVRAADAIYAYKSGEQQNIVVGPGPFDPAAAYSDVFISDPLTPTNFVDPLARIAGEYVRVTVIPRDQFGNLLYTCRDISVLLRGSTSDINGPIVVTNVGDGSYTATVRVSVTGVNIVSARYNSPLATFEQTRTVNVAPAPPSYLAVTGSASQVAGASQNITITAYDEFNNVATDYAGVKTMTFTGASASPSPNTTWPTVGSVIVNGSNTVDLTFTAGVCTTVPMFLYMVETAQINTTDGTLNANAHKLSVAVSHAAVNYLTVTGTATQTAGTAQTVTVSAFDAYSNPATGYAGSHNITFSGAGSTESMLPSPAYTPTVDLVNFGTATAMTFNAGGVATGSMKLYLVETAHVTATDGSINADAHKLDVAVSHATPDFLAITGNATQIAGSSQTITVKAYDHYNNLATTYAGLKSLTFSGANASPTPGTNPTVDAVIFGNSTPVTFAGGVATGSMILYATETAHINATDGSITAVDHKLDVVVSDAVHAYLKITGSGSQTAGVSQNITITAYDQYNNVAIAYTGSKTLTFSGANPSPSPSTSPTVNGVIMDGINSVTLTFVNGVCADVPMVLYKAESAQITAFDNTVPPINADLHKLSVTVTSATANYLAVTGSATQTAGVGQSITLTAYDAFNNIATGYSGGKSLTFSGASSSPAPSTAPTVAGITFGSATNIIFTSGVGGATMILYNVETAHINASDGSINAADHKLDVTVSPNVAAYFTVTGTGTQTAGSSQTITVTAYDTYNNVATGYTGSHDLVFGGANPSPVPATNPTVAGVDFGSATALTFTSGVATGTMYLYKVETAQVTAAEGSVNANSHKLTVVVSPDIANYLAITGTGTQTAGASQTITLTAYDLYNNVATGYAGAVDLTFSGANASPSPNATNPKVNTTDFGGLTNVTFTAGVATGTLYLYKVETAQISATDGTINANAHKLSVVVGHAAPNYLTVTGTGTQVAGSSQTITVSAYDAYSNLATGYTGAHSLTFSGANPSPAPATNPTVAAINFGSATNLIFTGGVAGASMYLYKVETAEVTATDGSINSDLHKLSVIVTEALPSYLTISGTGTQTAGSSQTITIRAYDAYNNLATAYDGSKNLTFSGASVSPFPSTTAPTIDATSFGATTGITFTAGVATGSMALYAVETAQVTATDGSINANSHKLTVVVSHDVADYFTVTGTGTQTAGTSQTITVTAYDAYSNLATGYTGSKSLTFSGANPSPSPSTNPTVASVAFGSGTTLTFTSGAATGTMYLYKAETAQISATDGSIHSDDHKLTVVVSHAAFNYLAVTGTGTQTAGTSQTITVTAYDVYNNVATGYAGSKNVTFSGAHSSPSPVTDPTVAGVKFGQVTPMTFTAGVGTGTMYLYKEETAVIAAIDGPYTLPSAHTLTVIVSHAPADKLTIVTQPSTTAVAGVAFVQQPVVRIDDPYGNTCTTDTRTITATRSTGTASLFGTTSVSASGGSATFTDLSYRKAETITIIFSASPALNTATSTNIVVSPNVANYFAVTGSSTQMAGTVQTVTVTAYDAYDNVATGYAGSKACYFSGANPSPSGANPTMAAVVFGNSTSLTFTAGVATASMALYKTELAEINVSEGAKNADLHKLSVTVTPSLLKDFIVYGVPDPHDLGTWQSVTVEPRDTYQNRKTNYTRKITFSNTDISAINPADYTFTVADQGIHTFVNQLKFSAAGDWWLTAIDLLEPTKYGAQADITVQRAVTITANNRSKTYGNLESLGAMPISSCTVTGIVAGVDPVPGDITGITLTSLGSPVTATVAGSPYAIVPSAATGPYDAAHYRIVYSSAGLLTVNTRPLTFSTFTASNKVYDGTTDVTGTGFSDDRVNSDVLTFSYTAAFDNKHVGTGKTVNYTGISVGGAGASNYYLVSTTGTATANITTRAINVTAQTDTKVYDGTTTSDETPVVGALQTGDVLTSAGSQVYNNSLVGTSKTMTASGTLINDGNNGDNYAITYVPDNTGVITSRLITVTVNSGQTKVYGESDPTPYTYTLTSGTLAPGQSFSGALTRVAGETVGNYAIQKGTLTIVDALSNNVESNYTVTFEGDYFSITNRPITITADAGQTKVYGTADPASYTYTLTSGTLAAGDAFSGAQTRVAGETVGNYAIQKGTLTIVAGATNKEANYTVTYVSNDFTITNRPITITATAGQSKTYGHADPTFTYSVTSGSLAAGDQFSGAQGRATGEDVGFYAINQGTLTIVDALLNSKIANYSVTYNSNDFEITKRPISITVNSGQTKIYGDADPLPFTYSVGGEGLASGDAFDGALTRATGENVGSYAISKGTLTIISGATNKESNYTVTFTGANFSITKRNITIAVNEAQSKIYADPDPVYTFTSSIDPLYFNGTFTGVLTRVAGENVGTYAISRNTLQIDDDNSTTSLDDNYNLTFTGANFSITKKPITITVNTGQSKVYGNADPLPFTYVSSVSPLPFSGTFTGVLTRAAGETVGNAYAISRGSLQISDDNSVTSLDANYQLTFNGANFSITHRPITITADAGQTKVYGDADPATYTYTLTSGTLAAGDAFAGEQSRVAGETVGNYAIQKNTLTIVEGATNKEGNYSVLYVSRDFTITNRPITITANTGQSKTYGHADPAFTYSVGGSGLVAGDQFSGALTRVAGENIGFYAILQGTLTIVDGSLNSKIANYTVTYNSNDFEITKRPISITVNSGQTKIYAAADPLPFTYAVGGEGLATGDAFDGVLARATGENVGSYAISKNTLTIISGGTNMENNYDVTFTGANFTITKRAITIAVNSGQTKVYAESDPTFTYTSSIDPLFFSGVFTGALGRVAGENAGDYDIDRGTLQIVDNNSSVSLDANYDLTFTSADFTITKKPITITVHTGQTKVYGYADPTFTYTSSVSPLPFSGAFSGALGRDAGNNVGSSYAINRGTLQIIDNNSSTSLDANYNLTFTPANFSITERPITITADNRTKIYGNTITMGTTQFSITSGTLAYSEAITGVTLSSAGEPISAHIGDYSISTSNATGSGGFLTSNYDITYSSAGTLTVTVRTLHLSNFGADSKIYDGTVAASGIGFDDDRIPGDNLAFTRDAAFTDPNVGTGKTVHYSNITISGGTDMNNYVLASTVGDAIANIYARDLTVTADDVTKPFGTTLTGGAGSTAFTASGLQNGESIGSVTMAYGAGAAAADPLGTYLNSVTPSAATGGTFSASNYNISYATGDITVINSTKVSGLVRYNNTFNTPMNNVRVELSGTGMVAYTNASGYYEFINVPAGTYTVLVTTTEAPGEAVNASDAAQANAWYVSENQFGQWPAIEKTRFFAGDVTGDHYVTSNDAQQIQAFFVNSWGTWTGHTSRADWTFWKAGATTTAQPNTDLYPTITVVALTNLEQNFYALITGDFNREYVPGGAKSASNRVNLEVGKTVRTTLGDVVDLPVLIQAPQQVGAVSLILNYPSDKFEVLGVTMNENTATPVKFNASGDELRIGWNSMTALTLNGGEVLLTVKVRMLTSLQGEETAQFTLAASQLNELADASFSTIQNATLVMDQMAGQAWGVPTKGDAILALGNYPNPFAASTTLTYTLPVDGKVTIEVRNMLGTLVKTVVAGEEQAAGDYRVSMDATSLAPGVYSATLRLETGEKPMTGTIKIVHNR